MLMISAAVFACLILLLCVAIRQRSQIRCELIVEIVSGNVIGVGVN